METITIDAKNFLVGQSVTPWTSEGGFCPTSYGLNLFKERGKIYGQDESPTDENTEALGVIVAMTEDGTFPSFTAEDLFAVDDDGNFYTIDNVALDLATASTGNKDYRMGVTDIVMFEGTGSEKVYVTSEDDIAQLSTSMTGLDESWWDTTLGNTALNSSYRHPMAVVEDTLYIADKAKIHTWDGTTDVSSAMQLPGDVNITTMIKHPDGRHLVCFCGVADDSSHNRPNRGRVYIVDTVTLEFIREIEVDAQVEGCININGVIYCTWGDTLGYFDGDGLQVLKPGLGDAPIYKHQMTNMEGILLIVDDDSILAYGDIAGTGEKAFWSAYSTDDDREYTAIKYAGDGRIWGSKDGSSTAEFYRLDLKGGTGTQGKFVGNRYSFSSKVWIRRIEVEHDATPASTTGFAVGHIEEDDTETALKAVSYTTSKQGTTRTRIDCNILTSLFKPYLDWTAGDLGISKIVIYYENGE